MPRYAMVCPVCGIEQDNFCTIEKRNDPIECPNPVCRCNMERDVMASMGAHPPRPFHKPIEMYSIAPENPEQLADLRRKCPDVKFNDLLVPLAHDRQEKLQILKAVEGVELS